MLQGDGPGKALDQGALDGAQPIGATEITFDIGDKAIECLGRASAAVELAARKQLRLGCRAARRAPFTANRASTPRTPMALTACACWERSIGWPSASCVFKLLQGDGAWRNLLRACRQRPHRCAAEKGDELAPFQIEHPACSPGATAQKLRLTAQQLQRF